MTAPLTVAGAVVLWRGRASRRAFGAIGALVAANWFCFTVVAWAMPRYRLAVEPILAICAAVALAPLVRPRPDGHPGWTTGSRRALRTPSKWHRHISAVSR